MMRMILELSWLWKFLSVFAAIAFVLAACAGHGKNPLAKMVPSF